MIQKTIYVLTAVGILMCATGAALFTDTQRLIAGPSGGQGYGYATPMHRINKMHCYQYPTDCGRILW